MIRIYTLHWPTTEFLIAIYQCKIGTKYSDKENSASHEVSRSIWIEGRGPRLGGTTREGPSWVAAPYAETTPKIIRSITFRRPSIRRWCGWRWMLPQHRRFRRRVSSCTKKIKTNQKKTWCCWLVARVVGRWHGVSILIPIVIYRTQLILSVPIRLYVQIDRLDKK